MTTSPSGACARLQSVIDASRVNAEPTTCALYAIDGFVPAVVARPASPEELAEVVRFAVAEKRAVIPCGARTKLSMGVPPSGYDIALDISALNQIAHYDPGDLTISVDAGMPVEKVNATLFPHHQFLPLLVPYYSQSTIGGTIASGIDSPLRHAYGTARDFLLGAEFVDGTGALAKSGGRVVKNVTGYDLHKLLIGSLGTLAVITRLNFRTFPAPLAGSCGFVASFPTMEGALALRRTIAQSALIPLTLDVLNPGAARIFATRTPTTPETSVFASENRDAPPARLPPPGEWFHPEHWQLCAAFAGNPEVLHRYTQDLALFAEQSRAAATVLLDDTTRPSVWGRLRESLALFRESSPVATVLKLSVLPSYHAKAIILLDAIAQAAQIPFACVARATGALYLAFLPRVANESCLEELTLLAKEVFVFSGSVDGHATMLFAPPALKCIPQLSSPVRPGHALMQRLKCVFDPQNIFAPGRTL